MKQISLLQKAGAGSPPCGTAGSSNPPVPELPDFQVGLDDHFTELEWGITRSEAESLLRTGEWDHDVATRFRAMALRSHPDKDPSPQAAPRFRHIPSARNILLSSHARHYLPERSQEESTA